MSKMRMTIVCMVFVSVVGLISWPAISRDQAAAIPVVHQAAQAQAAPVVQGAQVQAAAPVVADPRGQTAPGMEGFQLKSQSTESECFDVNNPPCGFNNCGSFGDGYSCNSPSQCCCRFKMCI
jgi:hypothetical protein